ncbi:MAG: helix-turn-helix transcriptional regulator [Clostridia bacterium]|nr:helix-turn-helix transcriptional regulator [Clostridia bacterium]
MNIGEKIRELRVAKLMTQTELAGTHITRNMLSCIENGAAQPSLSTILYIAKRLNVPAGFLLADEGDEVLYRKMNSFGNIKKAYVEGDLHSCRSLCLSACPEPDDEIRLLLADCDVGIAIEEFWSGKLRSACRFFDEALVYAEKTMYQTAHVEAQARLFFRYMRRLSPTLYSDVLDEEATPATVWNSPFAVYTSALEALDDGDYEGARMLCDTMEENSFFALHINSCLLMSEGAYSDAKKDLLALLNSDDPLNQIELYSVLCELEISCRETEDYKGAYDYATEKVQLLEQLLKES